MLVFVLGPSVDLCDTGLRSAQRSQIDRIYNSGSDTAEPSLPPHPSIHLHPTRTSVTAVFIYLFIYSQSILTSTLGYYLESFFTSCK